MLICISSLNRKDLNRDTSANDNQSSCEILPNFRSQEPPTRGNVHL